MRGGHHRRLRGVEGAQALETLRAMHALAAYVVCSDGIIFAVEKLRLSKMLVPGTDKRSYAITKHSGEIVKLLLTQKLATALQRLWEMKMQR